MTDYTPPKVWTWDSKDQGIFAELNRPIAGATHEKALPIGKNPIQLYSQGTSNGIKISIMLEELLALGHKGAAYDKQSMDIFKGDQFGSGFVELNPNSKVPAIIDQSTPTPTRIFESGAILLYLAKKFNAFLPSDPAKQAQCLSWLFWQVGSGGYIGGGFGHFYAFAPEKQEYPINRFTMEVKRQLDLVDKHLAENKYICGEEYSIADIAIWPYYNGLFNENGYGATEFLDAKSYKNVARWVAELFEREGVKKGHRFRSVYSNTDD